MTNLSKLAIGALSIALGSGVARAAEVVALGASNTFGDGLLRGEDYPAQLETLLRAKGFKVTVKNAGIDGDTSSGMLARVDSVIDADTKLVVLQVLGGDLGNDHRHGISEADTRSNISAIVGKLKARQIKCILTTRSAIEGLPKQSDLIHLTADSAHIFAAKLVPQVASALRH